MFSILKKTSTFLLGVAWLLIGFIFLMSMKQSMPVLEEHKLMVTFRIESGCLGPDGADKIDQFCDYAQKKVEGTELGYIHWSLIPRVDKDLPEIEYQIDHRTITSGMVDKYLSSFGKCFKEFEDEAHDLIADLIDDYLGH